MSPNNGTLFNRVLIPRLDNSRSACWFFMNLDVLLPHTIYFYDQINLPHLVSNIFEYIYINIYIYIYLHFKQYVNMF